MLKVAVVIAIIGTIYAGLYSLMAFTAPKVTLASSFKAMTGKDLDSVQDADYLNVLLRMQRFVGVYALTTVICAFFVLFVGFRKGQKWAWWCGLVAAGIAWLWGLIAHIVIVDKVNIILQAIGMVILLLALLLPIKVFFGKKAEESQEA